MSGTRATEHTGYLSVDAELIDEAVMAHLPARKIAERAIQGELDRLRRRDIALVANAHNAVVVGGFAIAVLAAGVLLGRSLKGD